MMGIKGDTCCDEHRVSYVCDKSLNSPETNIVLYVNQNLNKNFKKAKAIPPGDSCPQQVSLVNLKERLTPALVPWPASPGASLHGDKNPSDCEW